MRKQDSSELDELVGFLDSFMDNMNTEENPTCCQLTALDVITSIIFRRVRHYVENKIPINRRVYEGIIELLNIAGGYVWDTKVGDRIDSRIEVIESFYKAARSRQL